MNTAEDAQIGSQGSPKAFTSIAMDFADAIAVVIACPFVPGMADGAMPGVQTRVIRGFIGKQQRGLRGDTGLDNLSAGGLVSVLDHPVAVLASFTTDDPDNGWSVVLIGAASPHLVCAGAGPVARVGVRGSFFPPHSGRLRRPRKFARPSPVWAGFHTDCFGWCGAVA